MSMEVLVAHLPGAVSSGGRAGVRPFICGFYMCKNVRVKLIAVRDTQN